MHAITKPIITKLQMLERVCNYASATETSN